MTPRLGRSSIEMFQVTDCGVERPMVDRANISSLIIVGETAEEGLFPWSMAVFIDSIINGSVGHMVFRISGTR